VSHPPSMIEASSGFTSLVELLHCRAAEQPDDRAFVFLDDRGNEVQAMSFATLKRRALGVARQLTARGEPGDRALLLFPPGLDFIVAFFGCLSAGIIAVPGMVPRRNSARDATDSIVADCSPRFALTTANLFTGARDDLAQRFAGTGTEWLSLDDSDAAPPELIDVRPGREDIALLQYTSGSTAEPKGVMVSHANLLANLEMIRIATGNTRRSTHVSWVPLYHDMGLILNALGSFHVGATCVLMAPVGFMQRPLNWLRAIHAYRAEVAGGPNFAFDLCVSRYRAEQMAGIDLSCWKIACNAAETVRAETIERFAATFAPYGFDPHAVWPGYGMAEATVQISAGRRGRGPVVRTVSSPGLRRHRAEPPAEPGDAQRVVGCGKVVADEQITVVDPETEKPLPPLHVGEIWTTGPHIARGYWRNSEATREAFGDRIAGQDAPQWLRTGDLGFLDEDGEVFITGRRKELIIVRGINHYPQDIEDTVQRCHPALRPHGGAAFAALDNAGAEALVVVQEVERTERHRVSGNDLVATIREAIVNEHDIAPWRIVLIRPGALPKTTSGKIQRALTRRLWLDGSLEAL
jgi:acyl-CoA synthetase (AMP-forming)/AMP-acid ligase II